MRFYKDKYIIALYDNEDFLYRTFDNVREMSKELNIRENTIFMVLSRKGGIKINKKLYRLYLIEMNENELA